MIISDLEHLEIISPDASFVDASKVSGGGIFAIAFAVIEVKASDTAWARSFTKVVAVALSPRLGST